MNGFGHVRRGRSSGSKLYWAAFALLLLVLATCFWVRGRRRHARWRVAPRAAPRFGGRPERALVRGSSALRRDSAASSSTTPNVLNHYRRVTRRGELRGRVREALQALRVAAAAAHHRRAGRTSTSSRARGRARARHATCSRTRRRGRSTRCTCVSIETSTRPTLAPDRPATRRARRHGRTATTSTGSRGRSRRAIRCSSRSTWRIEPTASRTALVTPRRGERHVPQQRAFMPQHRLQPERRADGRRRAQEARAAAAAAHAAADRSDGARARNYITRDADWIDFDATVSTAPDQIAIAPGTCSASGRRTAGATSTT